MAALYGDWPGCGHGGRPGLRQQCECARRRDSQTTTYLERARSDSMTESIGTRGARQLAAEDAQRLRELIARLPKVELHQHLPGSLRTQTVIDLADEYGFELPSHDPEELRPYLQVMPDTPARSEEHTSELQSRPHLVCRLLLEKKKDWS